MSRATALAEAIKDNLNDDGDFSMEFTAVRAYRIFYSVKELKTLRVTVLSPVIEQSMISRRGNADVCGVDIVVQKYAKPTDTETLDALSDLVEEIGEFFRSTGHKKWVWLGTEIAVPYDLEDLSESFVFTSVIHLRYQITWVK